MEQQKYDKDKAKQLYYQMSSAANLNVNEDDFYKKLDEKDDNYARNLYGKFKKIGVNLLGANDENAFIDSLGYKMPELKEEDKIKVGTSKVSGPTMDSLKVHTPDSITKTEIPMVTPTAPQVKPEDYTLEISERTPQSTSINLEKDIKISDIIGESPQQVIQAQINELGEDAITDTAKVNSLKNSIERQLSDINSFNADFLKEYEANLKATKVNDTNLNHESWKYVSPRDYKKGKDAAKYISDNAGKYEEIQTKKNALQRQYDLLDTYEKYAKYGRQLEVGKRMSSMVSDGKISEDTMKILRSTGSEKAKDEYLIRLYNRGEIDRDTLKEIYNLGDLTEDNGFVYGAFKTGKWADILTLGMNEIARNLDINSIYDKYYNGEPITSEEMGVIQMYSQLLDIQKKAEGDEWATFRYGQGFQQSLRFVAEMGLTGGVNAIGKNLGVKGAIAVANRYGRKRALGIALGNMIKNMPKNIGKQVLFTPFTPSSYANYTDRLIKLNIDNSGNVSTVDKLNALRKAYTDTFTERFSETLGTIVSDVPLWSVLSKGKATKWLAENGFERALQLGERITGNEAFSTTRDLLHNVGITGIPEEMLSEMSGTLMNAALQWDGEILNEINSDFFAQTALTSILMGGMGGVVNYTAGSIGAIVQNNEMRRTYETAMERMRGVSFKSDTLNELKKELEDAMYKQEYVAKDGSDVRDVARIISDMNTELARLEDFANRTNIEDDRTFVNNENAIMGIIDNAVRVGAYRYGEQQAIKSYVADKMGVKDKQGNNIPLEFENEDGNVYEFTDNLGKNYFILDSSDSVVVLVDRATGEKIAKPKEVLSSGNITTTASNEWAMNTFVNNIDNWTQIAPESAKAKINETPATHLEINGKFIPVIKYDPDTNRYTISDEQGNETEFDANDPTVTPVWETADGQLSQLPVQSQQTEETPVSNGETTGADTKAQPEQEVAQTEENPIETEVIENEIEYDDKGDPVWSKITAERAKQEIDGAFDEDEAKAFVADKIKAAEKAVKTAEKKKPKAQNIRDRKAEIEQIKAERAQAQANLDYWNSVSQLYVTPQTTQGVVEGTPVAEGEVPVVDDSRDNPVDARARGFRSVEGVRYDRQQPIQTENLGNDVDVKFADGVSVKGKRAIIEATEAQPSHIGGMRNPLFFLNEAQPKDRTDKVSIARRDKIAKNIRPEEITGGVTAYTGSPVVNTRKEAIQGNGRLDALKTMYQSYPEQAVIYKQYLIDHAAEFGYDPQVIASMKAPILVDMIDVTDEQAIQLGQRTAQDIESGGEQKISAQNVAQTLGTDIKSLANILLKTEDEEADLNDVISENGYEALKWLTTKKVITETQMQTALDEKGNITTEAREALKDVLSQIIFQGGNNNIRKQFIKLPKAAQKALLQTIARELDSVEDNGILSDIQEAIEVYSSLMNDPDFKAAKGKDALMAAAESWSKQMQMDFTEGSFVPEDRYSKFALTLAVSFKADKMKEQTEKLNQLYDYLQAEGGDIFNPAVRLSREDAVKEVYNIELKDKQDEKDVKSGDSVSINAQQESTDGGQGGSEGIGLAQQDEQQSESTDSTGRPGESETRVSEVKTSEITQEIEITEELIDSLPVDDLVKLYAKQYINGKQNTVTRSAYQTIKEYVQNESRVGTGDSTDANTTQLDSRTDDATVQQMGTDGEQSGSMDRGQSDGDISTERPSGENSEGGLFAIPGEGSNSGVEQETSDDTDNVANNGTAGGRSGSKRGNVRKSRGPKGSTGVSTDAGQRGSETQSSIDDKIKSADDLISDALAEIEDILKNSSNTLGSLGNADMFKLIPATAKLGYALTKKGFYTFQKWFAQMQKHIGPLLQKHLTIEEVDEFIRDMWDTDFPFNGEIHTVAEWASMVEQEELRKMVRMSLEEKVALQKSRENVETLVEDLDNIRESLPFLLPQQQEDVYKAEVQFFSESHKSRKYGNGKGILFTNGTGTGKTYTGLGIVKRFVKQGKGRILIVTAQDKKIKDWIRDASNLGIEATQLKDTKDKGKGVVVTQFANMYQNRALLEDEWDLIVYDESHKLMESKDGRLTSRAVMHHMLSNRDLEQAVRRQLRDHELFKKEYELRDEMEYLNELLGKNLKDHSSVDKDNFEKYGGSDGVIRRIENIGAELDRLKTQQDNLVKQTLKDEKAKDAAQKAVDKTKVVFLSASPFNTAKNLDYVESYIFSYNPDAVTDFDGVRLPSELRDKDRDNFVLEKFPSSHYKLGNGTVQMRSEQQINNPEQSSQEEIDFSESLQQMGTLSGRTLDSEWDYSRQFPKFDFAQAEIFNRMYEALQRGKYAPLKDYFKIFTEYNLYTEYFEAIKTSLCLDRIKEHVELGRKVVVFHRRRSNTTKGGYVGTPVNDSINDAQFENEDHQKLMNEFVKEFAEFLNWERTANLDFANYQITEAFATEEEKTQYQEDLKKWQNKVKEARDKGVKKLPDRPTMKTKTAVVFNGSISEKEKRDNAERFNDPNSDVKVIIVQVASGKEGVDLHDTSGKFPRAEVNLYLPESPIEFIQAEGRIYRIGNKSNAVFEYPLLGVDLELASFAMKINGRAQTSENLALGTQSRGLRTSISRAALSSRPIEVSAQQGVGGKQLDSKQEQKREDFDDAIRNYNEWKDSQSDVLEEKQVPDPIGERMAYWAMTEGGDTVLVPYAGEGSVARYVDSKSRLVAYEASMARFSRLAMLCGGSGRKIENSEYTGEERYYSDNILYFSPDKVADIEFRGIQFALNRLADSGRMVILTTAGNTLRTNLNNRLRYDSNIIIRAEVKLPSSIIGLDGKPLELFVIDNLSDKELQKQAREDVLQQDLSNIKDETELWEALRNVQMPSRIIDNIAKTRKRAERALDNYIASSPMVKKRTEYSSTGKNKLVPKVYKSNDKCSFDLKHEGYVGFRYGQYTKGSPLYSSRNVESLANAWLSRQEYIKENENSTDKYRIEKVESYKAMCNFIEALLDKTPPQLRNLALGINENVITGEIDVPTLKDSIKGMIGNNAAFERLNDRVMKVAEAYGVGVEIVSSSHPKFASKSRNVQGFYSPADGKIWIRDEFINSTRHSNEKKAEVLLHEAIHSVTSHVLESYKRGEIQEGTPLYNACKDIEQVYENIKNDPIFVSLIKGKNGLDAANNEYGLTDEHEMLAELANPAFRAALKAKQLWRQLINGIKVILGIKIPGVEEAQETNALNTLEDALDVILENSDADTFNRTRSSGLFNKVEYYKKSYEIDAMYPHWLEGTTNESGKHSTQVAGTVGTYNKVGEWIEKNLGKDVEILDASSGMGLGTKSLREKGFNIEDVEPYQSEDRKQNNPATYSAYTDIDKQYDYIISNAVLNVIPDDWRADVLHNMAAKMKDGGKMFINTRKAGEEKSIKDKIELDTPQEVLVKRNGKIASYQKFFTPQELKSWVEQELGDGYTVEVANEKNSGTKGLAAVVVTKNNNTELTAEALLSRMEENAETAPEIELTEDSWYDAFGDNDSIETPIGTVKMGANQIVKIFSKNRTKEFGMIAPTLSNPDIIIEESSQSKDGKSERPSSYVFIKTFEKNGEKIKFYASITVKKDGLEVSVSSHYMEKNAVLKKINEGKVIYTKEALLSNNSEMHLVEHQNDVPDLLPTQENNALFEDKDTNSSKKTTNSTIEDSKNLFRLADGPIGARQHSEEVMRESIDKMAQDLGVNAEYVSDENQLDKKGWYDPATSKVYVNLAAHETIDDAKATYLHEVVGHFGLRGLLKDKFEDTMAKIFNSFPKELQDKLLKEYGSEIIAAEEYLASMIENDVEPSLVERILGFIREAIRSMGISLDNYTNGDLEYLLWRSKNNLRENAGHIEAAQWGAKNKEMRYRSVGRPAGYSTNTMEMTNRDKLLHAIQDRMRPVKKLMDEIVNRGGTIDETSDPHSQEFLASSRAAAEIEDFKNERYQPLADAIADAMKVFTEKFGMLAEDARKAVDDYLYARHAPERNKQICVNEIVDAGMEKATDKTLVNDAFKAEVRRMAGLVYDNQFRNGKNIISPNGLSKEQTKLAMAVLGAMNKKTIEISKETVYDEVTGQKVLRANNRSGMSDAEAEGIMKNLYTPNTKAVLDKVSARVKDCTDFTLDKWLEYGLISKEEYDSYKNQYEYYIPLRGWEEKGEDIDYMAIPTKQFNAASKLVTLNKKASGRTSKAENPLAYIASLAQSACVTGNKNLIRQQAFRMVEKNEGLIDDLAVIENTYEIYDDSGNIIGYTKRRPSQSLIDQGRVKVIRDRDYAWHKTGSELGAHRVPVLFNGVVHMLYFKGEIGALAATAINGTDRDTTHILTQTSAKATRWISSNLTAKNVYFLGKNLMRDLGFGNFAYFIENGAGKTLKLNRYFLSAMRTAAMDAMGADPATFADSALYEEFKLNGGQTGYIQMESLRNLSKQMDKLIKEASKDRGYISQQAVNAKDILVDTFDVLGKASENAMRFAIYKLEREKGSSPREAAIRAKEITVNFNRQGKNTKGFSAVYAFFNPAVQGAYRYAKLAKTNPGRFIGTTAALMAIKFGLGVICELFAGSGDDDEKMKGESAYDRLSDYVKATNWVIPLGGWTEEGDGKFLCIPMPQSVRGATHLSDLAVDVMFGRKDFGEAVKDFAMFNIGEFLPFDIDAIDLTGNNPWGTIIQAASPTILRPIVENVINRDFMGNPISKEPFVRSQDYIPQYQLAFRSTSPILVGTSKFLNELAGGDEKRSARYQISQNGQTFDTGWSILDINPAKIEHLFSGYFGGMFKPVLDVYDTMRSMADKDIDTDISSVALVNQFIKGPTSKPGYKKFYELRDEAQRIKSFKDLYKDDYLNEVNWALNGNKYNYEIYAIYEVYSDIIKMYNENIMLLNNNRGAIENYSSQVKELEKERDKMILEAASKYRDICERRDKENKEQE